MSSAITLAGQTRINQLRGEETPLIINKMVLALVPDLDPTQPVERNQQMPDPAHVVYTHTIEDAHKGYVNPDQVVYSMILGSDVGNFSFNWIGTVDASGVVISVTTTPETPKRQTNRTSNTTGNNITRNVMMQFQDAQNLSGITVSAQTWQFDYPTLIEKHNGYGKRHGVYYVNTDPVIADHGAIAGDDYDAGNLQKLIALAGERPGTINIPGDIIITTDMEIPANKVLDMRSGGTIVVDGCVLTINGGISADIRPDVFELRNGGEVEGFYYFIDTPTVHNIEALRETYGSIRQTVRVSGYRSPGDGGGGPKRTWEEDIPGTYLDTKGSVIIPKDSDGSVAWTWPITQIVNALDYGVDPTGGTNTTADLNNAIINTPTYPQEWQTAAVSGGLLIIPRGTYWLDDDVMVAKVNLTIKAHGAVFIYSGQDNAFSFKDASYCNFKGGSLRLRQDLSSVHGIHLEHTRWCHFSNMHISIDDISPYTQLSHNDSAAFYLFGGPSDSNDNLYNTTSNIRTNRVGWSAVMNNTDSSYTRNNCNEFSMRCGSTNGIKMIGSSGNKFNLSMECPGTQFAIKENSFGIPSRWNKFDILWFEVATPTFDIDESSKWTKFNVLYDNNANFPDLVGGYIETNADDIFRKVGRSGGGFFEFNRGRLILGSMEHYLDSGEHLQVDGNTRFGRSGGEDEHRMYVGPNKQFTLAQQGGWAGLSIMGGSDESTASFVLGNDLNTGGSEKWRFWFDPYSRVLNIGAGGTWKGDPPPIALQLSPSGKLELPVAGAGLRLTTPDGLNRYTISIDNTGAVITTKK